MSEFEYNEAKRDFVPLLLGVAGYSSSGKTYSSMRLATGMQRVIGGEIAVLDTESKRALQYSDKFKFRHVPFKEPFASLRYKAALEFCKSKGASIVVVDSMTHEHSSFGGYLDTHEKFLDDRAGDDDAKRQRLTRQSWITPSRDRKALNDWIVHSGMNIIFCYRAKEGMDSSFKSTGWQPETTSSLIWEMTARFLLTPGSDGRPTFNPHLALEKMLTKNPEFFRGWFKDGMQLDENLGEKLAQWAKGGSASPVQNQDSIGKMIERKTEPEIVYEDENIVVSQIADNPHPDDADYAENKQETLPAGALFVEGQITAAYAPKTEKQPWNVVIGGVKMAAWKKSSGKFIEWLETKPDLKTRKVRADYTSVQNGQYTNNTLVNIQSI